MTPTDLREATEQQLVLLLKETNDDKHLERVWGEIVRRHVPNVERITNRHVEKLWHVSVSEVDDIVAEALLKLYLHRDRLDPSQGVFGYFATIAYNVARDLERKRRRRPHFLSDELIDFLKVTLGTYNEPRDRQICRELRHILRQCTRRLNRIERQILVAWMRGGRGWAKELSIKIDMKAGTVRRRIQLILKKLARYVEEDFGPIELCE